MEKTDERVSEHKYFLMLNFFYPEHNFIPTHDIDCVWHCHVMDTQKCSADCELVYSLSHQKFAGNTLFNLVGVCINAGLFFDHFPYFGI